MCDIVHNSIFLPIPSSAPHFSASDFGVIFSSGVHNEKTFNPRSHHHWYYPPIEPTRYTFGHTFWARWEFHDVIPSFARSRRKTTERLRLPRLGLCQYSIESGRPIIVQGRSAFHCWAEDLACTPSVYNFSLVPVFKKVSTVVSTIVSILFLYNKSIEILFFHLHFHLHFH